jgi:anti-anti-sigma factor
MGVFSYEETGNRVFAKLDGDLMITNVGAVENTLNELLAKNPVLVGIDCSALMHIDSSAIATLVKILKKTINKKMDLILYDLSPAIREIFELVSLDKFFRIVSREEFDEDFRNKTYV